MELRHQYSENQSKLGEGSYGLFFHTQKSHSKQHLCDRQPLHPLWLETKLTGSFLLIPTLTCTHPVKMQVCLFAVPPEGNRLWRVKGCDWLPKVEHSDAAPHGTDSAQHPHHHPWQQAPHPGCWRMNKKIKNMKCGRNVF